MIEAEVVFITAGAGMGVDSGLPDFRGNQGFWKAYPPLEKLKLDFADMANPKWFRTDPKFAWGFYGHRLNLYRETVPHEGFKLLLDYVKDKDYFIYTSNVDGQFQKAGFDSEKIVECHGSIHHLQCCGYNIPENKEIINVNEETLRAENCPLCKICGKVMRPNILMFSDGEWLDSRTYMQNHRMKNFVINSVGKKAVVIEIGAGTSIPTVRMKSESLAKALNAPLIRINPRESFGGDIQIAKGGVEGIKEALREHLV